MDFRKSYRTKSDYNKQTKKNSSHGHEEFPILSDHNDHDGEASLRHQQHRHYPQPKMSRDKSDVVVQIESSKGNAGEFWRENQWNIKEDDRRSVDNEGVGSFHFKAHGGGRESPPAEENDDPPSRLIGQFLHKQRTSGDFTLDMDLEMEELKLRRRGRDLPPLAESPRTGKETPATPTTGNKVSFSPPSENEISKSESIRRRFKDDDGSETSSSSEVVRCSANASFRREISFKKTSSLLRAKTKSRLLDPPEDQDVRSGRVMRSGQIARSGMILKSGPIKRGGGGGDEEEEDPFLEEDLPDEFKRSNLSFLTLLQWLSLVLIVGALACTLAIPILRVKSLWQLDLWKWEVLILVLICGRLVSGWGIRLVVFFIERNFLWRKRVLYFVYGVRKAVQNCLWLGLVLIAWHFMFDKRVERETRSEGLRYVTKVLVCFLVGTLLWLVKTLIVKVLASSFHVSTYFDRIQDSLFNQFVIETLSGPPSLEISKAEKEQEELLTEMEKCGVSLPIDLEKAAFHRGGGGGGEPTPPKSASGGGSRVIGTGKSPRLSRTLSKKNVEEGITIDHLHRLNPKNVSAWNMKRLMRLVRRGTLTTLDEQIVETAHHDDDSTTQIRSEVEAKAAAKKIFHNVAFRGSKFIYLEDLMRFMREDEAIKTMSLFEGASESKKISKSSLKNWVVNAFRERRALALTLNDTKTAVNKLHRMVNVIVAIAIFVIWLLILGIATSKFLLFVSSQLVLVAFIFGNTCKTVFEALVFLFVMHPFDVGDRCEIDTVQMVVEEMNILTTVFLRYDNTKVIVPNSVLATKAINNFYRSPDMGDGVEFSIHVATPADKIATLRQRITNYVENKKEHWYPAPLVIMKELEDLTRVRMAVWLCHRMNHQDMGERYSRRSVLIEEMVKIFKELDIQYRLLPMEINVRAMPTVNSTRIQ